MHARNLMIVALQVLGVAFVVAILHELVLVIPWIVQGWLSGLPAATNWWSAIDVVLVLLVRVGFCMAMIVLARPIAYWFYPANPQGEADQSGELTFGNVGAGDLYRIACFAMGIYVLVAAVSAAAGVLVQTMRGSPFWDTIAIQSGIVQLAVLIPLSACLIFGSRGVAQALSRLSYDPDAVPNPQFALRTILILTAAVAVLLAVLRFLAS